MLEFLLRHIYLLFYSYFAVATDLNFYFNFKDLWFLLYQQEYDVDPKPG